MKQNRTKMMEVLDFRWLLKHLVFLRIATESTDQGLTDFLVLLPAMAVKAGSPARGRAVPKEKSQTRTSLDKKGLAECIVLKDWVRLGVMVSDVFYFFVFFSSLAAMIDPHTKDVPNE